jgi:uncharacterized protein YjbJ (UPF0337 family)
MNKNQLKGRVEEAKTKVKEAKGKVKEAKGKGDEASDVILDDKDNRRYIRPS